MEIIYEQKEAFHVLKLILLKSFMMFACSVLCGWIIYNFFPHWIDIDCFISIKTSIIGMILLFWLVAYPKLICSKIWGLCFISLLGGILFSFFFSLYGAKLCLVGCAIIFMELIGGVLLGKIFQDKINRSLFLKIVLAVFIGAFIWYLFLALKRETYIVIEPLYSTFAILAFAHLVFACANAKEMLNRIVYSKEKHPQNRYVILFYLNLMALGNFIESSRIIVLVYYHIIQILSFQKNK